MTATLDGRDLPFERMYTSAQRRLISKMAWMNDGACNTKNPDPGFIAEKTNNAKKNREIERKAKAICQGCPVRVQCLDHALRFPEQAGVWGGYNWEERKQMIKRLGIVHDQD